MMLATYSLWRRDVVRFLRQPSRIVGALLTPVIFWFVIGAGMGASFQGNPKGLPPQLTHPKGLPPQLTHPEGLPPQVTHPEGLPPQVTGPEGLPPQTLLPAGDGGFLPYYFPGSLALIVLFTAIFSTISIIEDRQEGFLQGVLASPAPRAAIVLGKALGGTTLALINGAVFLLLLPFSGLSPGAGDLVATLATVAVLGLALSGLGIMIAWPMRSTQGFHGIMNAVLVPMWLLSGALFPASGASGWVQALMRVNPLTPAVEMLRAFLNGATPASLATGAVTIAVFGFVTLSISTLLVSRPSQ